MSTRVGECKVGQFCPFYTGKSRAMHVQGCFSWETNKQQRCLEIVMMSVAEEPAEKSTYSYKPWPPCSWWQQRWINVHWICQEKDQINNSLWHEKQRDWYRIEVKTLNQSNFSGLELANALVISVSRIEGWYFAGHMNSAIQTQKDIVGFYGGKCLQP